MQKGLMVCAVLLATVAAAAEKEASPEAEERVWLLPVTSSVSMTLWLLYCP